MRRLLISLLVIGTLGGLGAALAGVRPGWGVLASIAISVSWILARGVLVRAAHSSYRRGQWRRSALLYRLLSWLFMRGDRRTAARVSRAACDLADGRYEVGLASLERFEPDSLDDAVRAAWNNNRAYALARLGRDLERALALSDEAVRARPGLAGFRHTRGVVLLALGRFEQAVRELDEVWKRGDGASSDLESERCFDIGVAWRGLGERDYAADYFDRAMRAAPDSHWAELAEEAIGAAGRRATSVVLEG